MFTLRSNVETSAFSRALIRGSTRSYHHCHSGADQRQRLTAIWAPTGGRTVGEAERAHDKLIRAGLLRQSHSGIFHLLPMGYRIQSKLESLIDKHMQSLGASRVALSSITSKKLWQQSGRYEKLGSELFNFQDRRGADYMLAPTHEEEVTSLVAQSVKSYKELPLRLYQMTRKYRDELRPRHGLLRTREFTMKDLYTFDVDTAAAMQTYEQVQDAYASFFDSLGLPVVKARAGSGDMGGDLSHEYHFTSPIGEDLIMKCNNCEFAVNSDIAEQPANDSATDPQHHCPKCEAGTLEAKEALEVGHTFHLGTRYSEPLGARIALPTTSQGESQSADTSAARATTHIQMGCHGIGVSRLIGAVAEHFADPVGLQWPRAISPYEVEIVFADGLEAQAVQIYDDVVHGLSHTTDVLLDDRSVSLPWKLKDADLAGYPIVVVLGQVWKKTGNIELQCRRLGIKESVQPSDILQRISELLRQL
ncbi:hypothetical protein BN1708_008579 [Verticillium longisporum]|uniref:proline--tRNA ligase n=1 Tax=Verticillium longisporum TaxID=100787 RepID=A0A0G4N686_VERLO|nr:proline--tRNA ligase like protein [Verticillium longisporum]CRK41785.1 hypothetical protein BN1708_008579 [Verticillium longisporum]